ncbi:MAG: type II toxin-antitoxin system VapC family toxin [Thermomicrobiales bacterium]
MRYLLDSDWIIDATVGIASAIQAIQQTRSEGIAVNTIALAEVYEGAFVLDNPASGIASFRRLLAGFAVLDVTEPIAERFAELRSLLRWDGNLIPDMDLLIAATALERDLTLLTRNLRHFERVPGLKLYRSRTN